VRNAVKRPDILIVVDALSAFDRSSRAKVLPALRARLEGTTWLWVDGALPEGTHADQVLEIRNGRVLEEKAEAAEPVAEAEPAETERADEALGAEAAALKEIPLFANLDPTRLKFLAFTAERKTYQPGEQLIREGEEGDAAYVILDGLAEVLVGEGENEKVLFTLGRSRVVGELALLNDAKRSATVRAVEPVTALRLNREVFTEMARQDPYFAFEMTRDLGRRLVLTTDQLNEVRAEMAKQGD
jgi:hypothetical protein